MTHQILHGLIDTIDSIPTYTSPRWLIHHICEATLSSFTNDPAAQSRICKTEGTISLDE